MVQDLSYPKFKLKTTEQEDLLSDYLPFCDTVLIPNPLPIIPKCRDIYDEPFLVLALVGHADYLVTGDRDLLCLADHFACPIVPVEAFFRRIEY